MVLGQKFLSQGLKDMLHDRTLKVYSSYSNRVQIQTASKMASYFLDFLLSIHFFYLHQVTSGWGQLKSAVQYRVYVDKQFVRSSDSWAEAMFEKRAIMGRIAQATGRVHLQEYRIKGRYGGWKIYVDDIYHSRHAEKAEVVTSCFAQHCMFANYCFDHTLYLYYCELKADKTKLRLLKLLSTGSATIPEIFNLGWPDPPDEDADSEDLALFSKKALREEDEDRRAVRDGLIDAPRERRPRLGRWGLAKKRVRSSIKSVSKLGQRKKRQWEGTPCEFLSYSRHTCLLQTSKTLLKIDAR